VVSKPQVFKMGGSWVWRCHHGEDRRFTQDFPTVAWNSAWDTALGDATRHALEYHVAPAEVIEP
jgi:hypothetical protein